MDKIEHFNQTIGVKGVSANGSLGANGNILTSNGTSTFWGPGGGGGYGNIDGGHPDSVYGGIENLDAGGV